MDLWKGRQKQQKKEEGKKQFKTGLLWEQNRQKTSKNTGNNHFGLLCTKQKHRNTEKPKKQNHQNQKNDQKTSFCILANHPYFC